MPDIRVENHGSVVLLRPLSDAGKEWLEANVINEETQRWGEAVVAEPRYVANVVEGMQADGLEVGVSRTRRPLSP